MPADLQTLKTQLEASRRAVQAAQYAAAEIREKLSAIADERETLRAAPLTRSDLEAVLLRDLQAHFETATAENSELAHELRHMQRQSIGPQIDGDAPSISPFRAMQYRQEVMDKVLLLSTPADILKRMKPVLDKIDFADAGPPLADRRTRLAELAEQERLLLAEQTEINALLGIEPPPEPAAPIPQGQTSISPTQGKVLPGGMENLSLPPGYANIRADGVKPAPKETQKVPMPYDDTTPNIYRKIPR